MQTRVDLNADMGESFGPWGMGDDAALLDVVSSANIACGFHAGDWDVMAAAMARAAGGALRHLKLHGALANMASEDAGLARACFDAALSVDPEIILMVLAGTAQEHAARDLGARMACEIFADRAYNPDGTLVDRRAPGAVIHDAAKATARIAAMLQAGAIIAEDGTHLPARIDTICLHGDTPEAVGLARALRAGLEEAGLRVTRFDGARG